MKKITAYLLIAAALVIGCEDILNVEEMPEAKEREGTFVIKLVDSLGIFSRIYNSSLVPEASVTIVSSSLGEEYNLVSDINGVVTLTGAISDQYVITCVRELTPEEMLAATGEHISFNKLVNSSTGITRLRADVKDTVIIYLDKIVTASPLLISEIYACGPPNAGNYYHDKYVEIFNQSNETLYLDGLVIAQVFSNGTTGLNYADDKDYVHSKNLWKFPGSGKEYPIMPGEYIVCAEDAIDHRVTAPESVDLSHVSFEFYKTDAPDIDNKSIPNMIEIYQNAGNDWLIGGRNGALVLARINPDSLIWFDEHYKFPISGVYDGVEYLKDITKINDKILYTGIDAGGTGGIEFYMGKTMERILITEDGKIKLKDNNNSSIDFKVYSQPSPEYHNED